MKIEKYGASRRVEYAAQRLSALSGAELPSVERIILLPIPTTRDGIRIFGTEVILSEVLTDIGYGDAVIGYAIPKEDIEIIFASGGVCVDLSLDEEFLSENARLTALGAVGYIMTELPRAVDELTFGVVGYGRIGERLVAYLTSLGAEAVIYTSKNDTRVALGAYGIRSEHYERDVGALDISKEVDVLVNTAPTSLAKSFPLGIIPEGLSVIELASGNNFEGVSGVVRLPSLPEKTYPESASEAYYRAILRGLGARL